MCICPNRDRVPATHQPPQTLRHRAYGPRRQTTSMFCCISRPLPNASQVSTTSKESMTERLFNRRSTTITNNSSVPAHVAITARPIQSLTSLSIYKVASLALDTKGEYRAQEIKIGPGRTKHVQVDSHRFYLTVFLFIDDEWHLLWNCRQVSASYRIFLNEYHTREARFSNPDRSHIRRASEFSIRPHSTLHQPPTKRYLWKNRSRSRKQQKKHHSFQLGKLDDKTTPPPSPLQSPPRSPLQSLSTRHRHTVPIFAFPTPPPPPPPYRTHPSFRSTYV